ncbi:hypothetical protein [Microbacterium sp.]|uniref:hypothetical protein n=1 Tax=Microbacterium sp. TaxID=51671 RepID=UPI003F702F8C
MLTFTEPNDYWTLFLIAAGCGALGGVAADLLVAHRRRTGYLSFPRWERRNDRITGRLHLGTFGPAAVGAIAAVAALWAIPPEIAITISNETTNPAEVGASYDIVRLVGVSIIVGTAGAAVIAALQARVTFQRQQQAAVAGVAAAQASVGAALIAPDGAPTNAALEQASTDLTAALGAITDD